MEVNSLQSGSGMQADMMQNMLNAPLKEADLGMKIAKVNMQVQLQTQEMAQNQAVVAQMTGVGGQLNAVV